MFIGAAADNVIGLRNHHDITQPVGRQLKPLAGLLAVHRAFDTCNSAYFLQHFCYVRARRQISRCITAQSTVMDNIRIGNRQNHSRPVFSQPVIEQALQINHLRPARARIVFCFHAMIGGQRNNGAESV